LMARQIGNYMLDLSKMLGSSSVSETYLAQ
jgi:hypothetical protein